MNRLLDTVTKDGTYHIPTLLDFSDVYDLLGLAIYAPRNIAAGLEGTYEPIHKGELAMIVRKTTESGLYHA